MGGRKFINKTGNRYGKLTVLSLATKKPYSKWLCKCDCGNTKEVFGAHLHEDGTKSCGCINKEVTSKRVKTHGMTKTPTYVSWLAMRRRCDDSKNASYKSYGAKGIKYCESWASFDKFLLDMGERPDGMTLDRIDLHKGYCKENCRWATPSEQQRNRSSCLHLTYNGVTKTAAEWSKDLNLAPGAVWNRIKAGWPVEVAVTKRKAG